MRLPATLRTAVLITATVSLIAAGCSEDNEPETTSDPAEFAAQERFGKSLGQAIDVQLTVAVNDALSFVGAGGVFLPGEFYEIEVDKVAGNQMTSLGHESPEMFWAASAGMEVSF